MPVKPQSAPILLPDERLDVINEGLRLIQKKNGLTFGTDAYLLAAFVRPSPRAIAADLGSGTGIHHGAAVEKKQYPWYIIQKQMNQTLE